MKEQPQVNPENLYSTVQSYFPEADIDLLKKAFETAEKAHIKQKRASGEPYIAHPLDVAMILAGMKLDLSCIITGLLHDTVEDTSMSLEDVSTGFGQDIAELVDGVTKLSKISFRTSEEKQAENFRKMIVAMAKDIRVILVKLADRVSNMRTLEFLPEHKQRRISQETLDIYAPIANRLGISWIKTELEDLCLRFLHPDVYYKLAQKVSKKKRERQKYIDEVCEILEEKLKDYDIQGSVFGRAKHFYSIYKKMDRRNVDFDQVFDVIAFRILVSNITECYKALGVIHAMYKPVPGRFKDYIAIPKANSYQSLHTTVIGPYGERIEIQIRTQEMHQIAETGIAAHWRYKEGKFHSKSRENIEWVNRLLEWHKDLTDPNEFLETVKIDLFAEDVFVFTPKGEIKQLPYGGTPLDFAYAIHTDVGHRCIGAKLNGKIVPLKHRLKSGDTVEVLTSTTQTPSKDWLKIVKSSKAKAKIRAYIKQQERERAREMGKEIFDKALKSVGQSATKIEKSGQLNTISEALNHRSPEGLYVALGYGRITPDDVLRQVLTKEELEKHLQEANAAENETFLKKIMKTAKSKSDSRGAILVADLDDVLIRFGKCCNPLPGDSIVGFITRGRGVTIHTANCPKALDMDLERRIEVRWNDEKKGKNTHRAKIRILALDKPGILAEMTKAISALNVNISSANIRTTKDEKAIALFDVEVSDVGQLSKITHALEGTQGVIAVQRTRS